MQDMPDGANQMRVDRHRIGGAVASVGKLVANGWTGNTPQVRQQVAKILLQRAPNMTPGALEKMVNQTVTRLQRTQSIVRQISRATTGAVVSQENQR
jgi:hypothetical protein